MSSVGLPDTSPSRLRRTVSTGDLPGHELSRPERARIAPSYRTSDGPLIETSRSHDGPSAMTMSEYAGFGRHGSNLPMSSSTIEAPDERTTQPWLLNQRTTLPTPDVPRLSWFSRLKLSLGYGRGASRARRALVDFIWNISWGCVQIVIIITVLGISAHTESPTSPGLSEWAACERPLGLWDCLWLGRVALACLLSYWGWRRDRKVRTSEDVESGQSPANRQGLNSVSLNTSRPPPRNPPPSVARSPRTASANNNSSNTRENSLLYSQLYARLTLLSSLLTLTWFLTAHILEYTSVNTCRRSSPHLWWLTFGIICIMYFMVLEVVVLGFFVFIIAPIIFILYNIVLICLGRHPVQNPTAIKPEIKSLPQADVDRIPLVVYIPPPPEECGKDATPVTTPKPIYAYPPKPKLSPFVRRFTFLKNYRQKLQKNGTFSSGKNKIAGEKEDDERIEEDWEDLWEQGEYPFVRLENHRAACAICLLDFEEPPKKGDKADKNDGDSSPPMASQPHDQEDVVASEPVEEIPVEPREGGPKLEDAGEGVQPLRLLECGHVFHKLCLDPWLIGVSGRCPCCQRPVSLPDPKEKKRKRRRQNS